MEQFGTAVAPAPVANLPAPVTSSNGQAAAPTQQPLRIQFDLSQIDVEFMVLMDEVQASVPGAFAKTMRYLDARTDVDLMKLPFNQMDAIINEVFRQVEKSSMRGN